jgi:hypothetical protein
MHPFTSNAGSGNQSISLSFLIPILAKIPTNNLSSLDSPLPFFRALAKPTIPNAIFQVRILH